MKYHAQDITNVNDSPRMGYFALQLFEYFKNLSVARNYFSDASFTASSG